MMNGALLKRMCLVTALVLLFGATVGTTALAAGKTVSLQLDGEHQFRYAGYYAALWQGYYERAGINVDILSGAVQTIPGFDVISSVIDGDSTFGIAGAELLLAHDRGYPVVALAVILQRSSIDLYITEDQLAPTPDKLEKVGIAPKPMHWLSYELMFNNPDSGATGGQAVPLSSTSPVELNNVNGMFGDSLVFPYVADQLNIDVTTVKPQNHGVDLPGSTIFTSRSVLQNNPDVVEAFVVASLEGWRYALQNSDEIATRLTREGLMPGASLNNDGANFYQIKKVRELTMYPVVPLGNNSSHRWAAAHELLFEAGLVRNSFSARQYIYDPIEKLRARAKRNEWWLEIGLPMLMVMALAVLFAYGYHWQLQRKAARKLYREANYDALTGLPNRPFALRYLASHIESANAPGTHLLFIDLDGFKRVNDQFGHAVGDEILLKAAKRLQLSCNSASMVARLGGDEFIALFCNISSAAAARIAASTVTEMKRPFHVDGREIHIGASIGGVHTDGAPMTDVELLQQADTAMYHAKLAGRGKYREFDKALHDSAQAQHELETHLHRAIAEDELSLCYQPIISLGNQRCVGAEALLRWHSTALGNVSPDRFIPVAEASGLIEDIGAWVLARACKQWSQWQREYGEALELAVNVSPRQFYSRKLLALLSQIEQVHNVAPTAIKLEITEGLLANSNHETEQLLDRIVELGYTFSIDDFGTGYASLNYLRQFPASTLKIDRSFIAGLFTDERNQPLVTAIIGMAHSLGLYVVAEGVETRAQAQFLRNLNCDYAQGYLFSKPLDAARFSSFLKQQSQTPATVTELFAETPVA